MGALHQSEEPKPTKQTLKRKDEKEKTEENKKRERAVHANERIVGYADDYTLRAVVPSLGVRVTVAESLNRDLCKVSECSDLLRTILIPSKIKIMIVSQSPPLTNGRVQLC